MPEHYGISSQDEDKTYEECNKGSFIDEMNLIAEDRIILHTETNNNHEEIEGNIEDDVVTRPKKVKKKSKQLEEEILENVETDEIHDCLKQTEQRLRKALNTVKPRVLRHIKSRVETFDKSIALNANVTSNMSPETSALNTTLPIKDVAEFETFDTELFGNVEKIDALNMIMTIAIHRCENTKDSVAAILGAIVKRDV
ncbi:uncharacterized protein LOC117179820 [Belonocnema kinseyi]|uniref:uncharacterized protein LOC117179820 n=1 Tax=Belonocnema kinseyi TaxID=2817044 RepID=UPI00143DCF0D|nr:uncharacterized protein LOC117179820 [Belonocnema kinseyi]XP_033227843.1 uncharacterized protein LOC117179820 [Belonocnema kinseyi]XP_033227844.1 uncharacterized protein LOC117179820 [Belonocnema kinseyi]XP_033227845.1 uncharacterized protein LOC117179820 [Belonocnema kinseyi]XP_033227846.1 uncharacterized protein LOC117179820 [Belonocnema kinseyi]XP_033227847.1 uncharacterized protein LOC117179820 [Belonocnema kinseyi]XP_033227848.1 uncharacterized protein LOC117179820 [Belonocnema kinsey